jgi:dihydrodipicolinate synthase/N-acetylneuraminate lyase
VAPRVVVALLTPHGDDGALRAHVDFLIEAGVDALMPCGTTGECALLTLEEAAHAIDATIRAAGGRAPVLAHVGRASTAETLWLAQRGGAESVSAVVPYYYAYSDDQIVRHYDALIAAVDVPVYAYNIPQRTGNDLTADVVRRIDGLAGVKDSTKSWERHLEYLQTGLEIYVGTDAFVREAFSAGAAGCVSALANVRPDLLCRLRDGEDVHDEIVALRAELPFQKLKAAVAERIPGYPTAYRAPLG